MTEERVSSGLYRAATADSAIEVLSWQSIDGKNYFAADIKIRLPDQRRFEPDLIVFHDQRLWLIEVKDKHSEAISDETKLAQLLAALGEKEVLCQIQGRSGIDVSDADLVLAIAYRENDISSTETTPPGCVADVLHIDWKAIEGEVATRTLGSILRETYLARQSNT